MVESDTKNVDLSVEFAGLGLKNPIFTASGTCGYIDELADFMNIDALGGFITKSISPLPRKGNPVPRIVETSSGMLNAIGLANIGLERFIDEKLPIIERYSAPVFVNLAGETIEDYVCVASSLAQYNALAGFELNISCPNVKKGGISFGTDPAAIKKITSEVKAVCSGKPLIVKLTPTVTDISITAQAAVDGGADAISLVNTFTAMVIDIEKRKPVLANKTGGLSGPAIKPIAVYLVNKVYNEVAKDAGVPIMGLGGIRTVGDVIEFMLAGASVVCVGTASFSEPAICQYLINRLKQYCRKQNIGQVSQLTGALLNA
jgi:dihydroorotate dehydrogenase (NAD+) catalytic subunit